MDTARYAIAVLIIGTVPFAFLFWLAIHPFARFWRRLGPVPTYVIVGSAGVGLAWLAVRWRGPLLAVEFGTHWALIGPGILLLAAAVAIGRRLRRQLTWRILVGLPELSERAAPGRLLTEGIYARIRHPRYVAAMLGVLGYALVANYLAGYAIFALCVPMLFAIVALEERELRTRFGEAYSDYCRAVPRFIPRRRRPA